MKLVAFVFSPLQALNLLEYSQRFDRPVDVVVVGTLSGLETTSRTQIDAVLSLVKPRTIIYRTWLLSSGKPLRARRAVSSAVSALREHLTAGPYEFVVGEYRNSFSWAVLHRLGDLVGSVVVVDDGTAMLRIDRRRPTLLSRKALRLRLKSLIFLVFGVRGVLPPSALTFFTIFALEAHLADSDTIVRNDYRTLSAELRKLPPDEDSVYVIGTPHREAGVMDTGDVELALELARFAGEWTGKEVVYMAHRRERAEKLDALRAEFTVVMPDVPFEIYPRVIGKQPRAVVGYYSSLFATVADLLGDSVDITALQIPRDGVNESWLPFVEDVYRYYRTELASAVKVIEHPTLSRGTRR
ncbi:hypothetical protein [Mycobacterium sp. shizuoka-1]|uniref:hypothetical protein n=1 Tax=Mycobacterium sp. shizuoka-1 TaxID=2039281 RepID=UPI000C05FAA8|nr:hypothetical protein [Mycobacterium sp. shizuoka-1]GAY16513.1 hypothetical protein MSZK_32390 [Mycobacterium sp. shizuoka-1]